VAPSTAERAWKRRDELVQMGKISRKSGSGQPKVFAFRTPIQKRKSIDICENLPRGEHLPHAAKKLGCGERTLQRHLSAAKVKWRVSPSVDAKGNTPEVEKMRLEFGEGALTRGKRKLKKKLSNATYLDHKQVHAFGINRSHNLQARRRGSKKKLRPKLKANFEPKIHGFFFANKLTTGCYLHCKEVPYIRKEGTHLEHERVNARRCVPL